MTTPDEEARALARLVVEHAPTQTFLREDLVRASAAGASTERPFGLRGEARHRARAPFRIGLLGGLGVAVAAGLVESVVHVWSVLILILLAAFVAVGLDPAVRWLISRGWRRGWAVTAVLLSVLAVLGAFFATAVPAVTNEYDHLSTQLPTLLSHLQARHDTVGHLARQVHLSRSEVSKVVTFKGAVKLAEAALSVAASILAVAVLTAYFLANLPAIKATAYRLVPRSRRARVGLLTDEALRLVGGYLLGNLITSAVAGAGMTIFLLLLHVPDAFFLGLLVALFDLIPMVGAPVAGVIVAVIALSQSLPTALAVVGFTIAFRLLEDYLLSPRVMRATVEVAPVAVIIGVLLGGALLGVLGALIAIPIVATIDLIRNEVLQPRLDEA